MTELYCVINPVNLISTLSIRPQIACRSEMEARAKELIEMLASPQLLPLAIKYAGKLGRIHLAEKLGELLPQFQEQVNLLRY